MIKLELNHVDTCLSCYWGGHHMPHVQIAVYPGIKLSEIKSAIRSELAEGAVMGSCDTARLLAADMVNPDEERAADQATRAAYAAINRMKPNQKGQRSFFRDLEPQEEDDAESVYAYFVFAEI